MYVTLINGVLNRYALNAVKILGFDKDDRPTDVRENLLFLGFGQLMAPRDVLRLRLSNHDNVADDLVLVKPIQYLSTGSISWVQISHVTNPGLLYVQPLALIGNNGDNMTDLFMKMKNCLENNGKPERLSTSTSHKGQICALKLDGRYFRVRIERYVMTTGQVQVLSIDCGWRKICQIKAR